ncbi:hypothetical protein ADUPG1_013860 [Aduncisulcus paluster]|uniref:UBC core domain-containing protein n=1 Tax=Aduncisulcus paluster TaxID=2918883 RepID=A0ABQ5K4G5_9EUKA|nr:hypothetical protein ADUPG1_013860 [Aduncisulcus paluster]
MSSKFIRRVTSELKDLAKKPQVGFKIAPLSDMHEIHFSMEGADDSVYSGGIYHGRLILSSDYPFHPPDIELLNPNGRWEINRPICLSITSFHKESWAASWNIRSVLIALQSVMLDPGLGAVGAIELPSDERKRLALKSRCYKCLACKIDHKEMYSEKEEREREEKKKREEEEKRKEEMKEKEKTEGDGILDDKIDSEKVVVHTSSSDGVKQEEKGETKKKRKIKKKRQIGDKMVQSFDKERDHKRLRTILTLFVFIIIIGVAFGYGVKVRIDNSSSFGEI